LTFKVSSQTEGTHTVQVGDQKGSFTVITTPQTVSIWSSLAYIAGILIIIAVVVASVYALYRRGRLPTQSTKEDTLRKKREQ
jgi:hypothetical protein